MSDFIHLRAHSDHSVEEGLITPAQLTEKAAADGQGAVALTDLNRMFGTIPFYKAARGAGVKPIIGADVWVEADKTQPLAEGEAVRDPQRILLLCENEAGYRRLLRWMSRAYLENSRLGKAAIKQSWLEAEGTEGLIALSGTPDVGEVAQALLATDGDGPASAEARAEARRRLDFYKSVFPERFFLEVQRYDQPREKEFVARTVALAVETGTPLVATHPIAFAERSDFFLHEVRTCVASKEHAEDPGRVSAFTREQYFRTRREMEELFQDLPEALDNAAAIAARCSTPIELGKNYLPMITGPNGEDPAEFLRIRAREGLEKRLLHLYPDESERSRERARFDARLEEELGIIIKMGFPSYYLIVEDFINWAKDHDIPVGPGRGSGAGSLVAYALNITDIEPLRYNLLFERFLNPERVSMPDFDIDFCIRNRDQVIDYVRHRYGEQRVSQIATVNTLGAKAAIKDVARTLGFTNNFSQMLSDLLSKTYKGDLDEALGLGKHEGHVGVPKLREKYDTDKNIRRLLDLARRVEGAPRTIGVHAAGVLIAPNEVSEFSPQYVAEEGGAVVSQYDKDMVEAAGLVKFDFLGLANLTIVKDAVDHINRRPEFKDKPLSLQGMQPNDPEVFKTFQEGRLVGVFQMESEGMTRSCTQLKPTCFEDIIALVSLYRPGPMALIPSFCRRKNGEEEVEYPDPRVEPILKETYGIMVYQEQVMQMAQIIGGYSLGGADLLRRAMGKKKAEEMVKQRAIFAEGAAKNGVSAEKATAIFDLMEKFADYGFNKSHAAAYAMVSYQTAWLKTHYPAEYYAALMNNASADTAKIDGYVKDARANGIKILPPDINEGKTGFEAVGDKAVRYGLAGLKGVGDKPISGIVAAREQGGPFTSLFDFCQRMKGTAPKNVIQALARAGAFDSLHPNRASVFHSIADGQAYVAKLAKRAKEEGPLVPELFADAPAAPAVAKRTRKKAEIVPPVMADVPEWSELERLEEEARAVGFALSGHPYTGYAEKLGGLRNVTPLARVDQIEAQSGDRSLYLVAGIVSDIREITTGKGDKMAFVSIDDGSSVKAKRLTMFPDAWGANSHWIKKGMFVAASATIRPDNRGAELGNDLAAEFAYGFDAMQEKLLESVDVVVERTDLARLKAVLDKHRAPPAPAGAESARSIPITVYMPEGDEQYFRATLPAVPLKPSNPLIMDLEATFGVDKVKAHQAAGIALEARPPKNKRSSAPGRRY